MSASPTFDQTLLTNHTELLLSLLNYKTSHLISWLDKVAYITTEVDTVSQPSDCSNRDKPNCNIMQLPRNDIRIFTLYLQVSEALASVKITYKNTQTERLQHSVQPDIDILSVLCCYWINTDSATAVYSPSELMLCIYVCKCGIISQQ